MSNLIQMVLGLVYPRRCPFCDNVIGWQTQCEYCNEKLEKFWLEVPRLPASEHYFSHISGAAAILKYDGMAREAVLRMKNGGKACYAPLFAAEMARRIFGCMLKQKGGIIEIDQTISLKQYDVIVPVPSAGNNDRGYNVPDLLAKPLAEFLQIPVEPDVLVKQPKVGKQEGKSAQERLENVKNAFSTAHPEKIDQKRVLLVDDVITTGATVSECAKQLLLGGANDVFAVSVAETQYKGI